MDREETRKSTKKGSKETLFLKANKNEQGVYEGSAQEPWHPRGSEALDHYRGHGTNDCETLYPDNRETARLTFRTALKLRISHGYHNTYVGYTLQAWQTAPSCHRTPKCWENVERRVERETVKCFIALGRGTSQPALSLPRSFFPSPLTQLSTPY